LVGVSTLEALAAGYDVLPNGTLCPLLHAGRGELYAALYSRGDSQLQPICPEAVLSPEAVASMALALVQGDIHLIGDGVVRYRDRLEAAFQGRGRITERGLSAVPSATTVARLAFGRMQGASAAKDIMPVYLRRAEAELNWEKGLVGSPLSRLAKAAR
jgi:tRNA A37 threonylcarbamoyladenosine modification protein TsaB